MGAPAAVDGLVAGTLHQLIPERRAHAPSDIVRAVQGFRGRIPTRPGLLSTATSVISLGAGTSTGQYGPLAHLGATLGSAIAHIDERRRWMDNVGIGCGVASATATGFNAPLAGLVFAHEVILRHYSMRGGSLGRDGADPQARAHAPAPGRGAALVRREDEAFYVEATVCGQGSGGLRVTTNEVDAVEKIRAAFKAEEVEIHSDLWLEAEGALNQTLSSKGVSRPFIDLMRRTTAAEVQRLYGSDSFHHEHGSQHREVFEFGAWRLEGVLHPKPHEEAAGHVWGPARSAMGDATKAIRSSLDEKASPWRKMAPPDGILMIAMSVCHTQYFWKHGDEWNDGDETRAIVEDWTSSSLAAPWREEIKTINGILFVGDVSLGNERATRARLHPNPERCLPESLASLTREHGLAKLTGFPPTPARTPSRSPEHVHD